MFEELKKMIKILKELNNSLEKKILTNKEIKDATEYVDELNLLKKNINEVSDKLINNKTLEKKEVNHLLIHLHLHFVRYISNLEEIWNLLRRMVGNYGD